MSRAEDIFQKLIYLGEDALDEFIINRQSEELFLDFKQSFHHIKHGNALNPNDRKNLAKAISGFANSEGGVLIWGVECYRDMEIGDVAKSKKKVTNVYRFLSWMENAISGCTIPSHNKVRNHIISVDENGDGFLATYIPKSDLAPLMSVFGNNIYIRSGSNNVPAPYSVIAGMFGKRPQPNIEALIAEKHVSVVDNIQELIYPMQRDIPDEKYVKIEFSINADNDSNVIARELYLSCTADMGESNNKIRFSNYNQLDYIGGIEGQLNLITKPEFRLPPRGIMKMANATIILSENIEDDFTLEGVIGANEAAPRSFRIYAPKNKLRSFVAKVLKEEELNSEKVVTEFFNEFMTSMDI